VEIAEMRMHTHILRWCVSECMCEREAVCVFASSPGPLGSLSKATKLFARSHVESVQNKCLLQSRAIPPVPAQTGNLNNLLM